MIKEAFMKLNSPILKVISILTVAILSLSFFLLANSTIEKSNADTDNIYSFNEIDDAVQYYLKSMDKEKYKVKFFENSMGGMVPYRTEFDGITLTEGEKNKTFKNYNQYRDFSDVRELQRKYVIELFGEGAWENCTYELYKAPGAVQSVWVNKESKEIISEEEAQKILDKYWKDVAKKENVDVNELIGTVQVTDPAKLSNYLLLQEKYEPLIPIVTEVIPENFTYTVTFSFNGKKIADSGENTFKIEFINDVGEWRLFNGLTWNTPNTGPESDI